MELAVVLLFVLFGVGAIVYAGIRKPAREAGQSSSAADSTPVVVDNNSSGDAGGSGDGGGD